MKRKQITDKDFDKIIGLIRNGKENEQITDEDFDFDKTIELIRNGEEIPNSLQQFTPIQAVDAVKPSGKIKRSYIDTVLSVISRIKFLPKSWHNKILQWRISYAMRNKRAFGQTVLGMIRDQYGPNHDQNVENIIRKLNLVGTYPMKFENNGVLIGPETKPFYLQPDYKRKTNSKFLIDKPKPTV